MATFIGTSANDVISGTADADEITGGDGNDLIFGGDGDDSIDGGSGRNILKGGDGHDYILGGNDDDVINGGSGNDTIFAHGGGDLVTGDDGKDTFELRAWGDGKYGTLTITDFTAGAGLNDRINLDGFSWESEGLQIARNFDEILAITTQVGSDTHIALTDDYNIVLKNVAKDALAADDFQNYFAYRIGTDGDDILHDTGAGGG